jgi:hypothetical protein
VYTFHASRSKLTQTAGWWAASTADISSLSVGIAWFRYVQLSKLLQRHLAGLVCLGLHCIAVVGRSAGCLLCWWQHVERRMMLVESYMYTAATGSI